MCWSVSASVVMVAAGAAATAVCIRRGDPVAIWAVLAYFTAMEGLQAVGYSVLDQCGRPENRLIAQLSYLHIAFQPLAINAFAMAIAPAPVPATLRRVVWGLAGLASVLLLARLLPWAPLGQCAPGGTLCGPGWCVVSGNWHIGWEVPLNAMLTGGWLGFPDYLLAVFALPLVYGAWRFALFHLIFGPLLAHALTDNPNEMPAIWCLFSVGLLLIGLSPWIRGRVFGAQGGWATAAGSRSS